MRSVKGYASVDLPAPGTLQVTARLDNKSFSDRSQACPATPTMIRWPGVSLDMITVNGVCCQTRRCAALRLLSGRRTVYILLQSAQRALRQLAPLSLTGFSAILED